MNRSLALATLFALGVGVQLMPTDAHALGLLIPKNTKVRPFDVESHRVNVTITNTAALTKITQVFRNHTNGPMEATFVFPIPEGATVSNFSLWINGKKTPGAVLEKKQARRIYESIVRRVQDPGLVEYMDGKLFRAQIFPIPAKGTQKLEIQFGQVLKKQGSMYRYSYPLRVGKDYVTAKTQKDFTLTAKIHTPIPLTTVYSPSHKVSLHRKNKQEMVLGTEKMYAKLDQDFELFFGMSKKDIGLNVMTHDTDGDGGENGYFMMALAPRVDVAAHQEIGQTFTFVMDTSGSMAGPKMDQARKTLAYCLSRLKPQDHFNVIRFSTDVEALHNKPVAATADAKKKAIAFAKELQPAGGTAIEPALKLAVGQKVPKHQPHQVIFVTDGIPTVGQTDPAQILKMIKTKRNVKTRLFTFGVGYDVNTNLLDGIAAASRGRADYVKPTENMETAVAALYTRISSPVLTNIKLNFNGARIYDMYPKQLPDLFRGDQIVIFGRYRGNFAKKISVSGQAGTEAKVYNFGGNKASASKAKSRIKPDESFLKPLEFLPKLWATRKVGYLLEQIRLNGEQKELKTEVIRLAKKFGLVTPYTSYLAVDDSEFQQPTPTQPTPRPDRPTDTFMRGQTQGVEESKNEDASNKRSSRTRTKRRVKAKKLDLKNSAPAAAQESFKDFSASSGKGAVDASLRTREYKEKATVTSERQISRRYIAGRTFILQKGYWVQNGVKTSGKKVVVVEAYSTKFFNLLRKHRELRSIAKLGQRIYVKLDGRIYKIVPARSK